MCNSSIISLCNPRYDIWGLNPYTRCNGTRIFLRRGLKFSHHFFVCEILEMGHKVQPRAFPTKPDTTILIGWIHLSLPVLPFLLHSYQKWHHEPEGFIMLRDSLIAITKLALLCFWQFQNCLTFASASWRHSLLWLSTHSNNHSDQGCTITYS